jgi:hypothetical protein
VTYIRGTRGDRKQLFGQQARHVMTVVDRQPQPGSCDQTKQRMETDARYIARCLVQTPRSKSLV